MNTVSILKYYFNLIAAYVTYYFKYGISLFSDYPAEIKVAVSASAFSVLLIIIMIVTLFYLSYQKKRRIKLNRRIEKRFGKGIDFMLSEGSRKRMSRYEIADVFEIDRENVGKELLKNNREKEAFVDYFYQLFITVRSDLANRDNITTFLFLFGIPEFLEKEVSLRSMKRKVRYMSMIRTFKLPVSPWVINKLLSSKYLRVQRMAMYSNIMLSSDSDLDYFETDFFDKHCCIKDEIELAYSLQRRRKAGRKLPNLARWANLQKNERSQCMFVRLMRRFNQLQYCDQLTELYKTQPRKKKLIEEISRTWGYLNYSDGEDLLVDALLIQPDDTKVAIMHALTRFATGKSLGALLEGYYNTTNPHVRFEAIRCIYNYGEEGRAKFYELKQNALETDLKLFDFFDNPITLEKIRLDKEQAYHPSVETVYNS
ncbi:MAG: HEAT repeat domain-containing protein [Bacteroidaceae bacterium]|nr:HEAT repeat domain-containing protein [Bacteroidaceae bacterium]